MAKTFKDFDDSVRATTEDARVKHEAALAADKLDLDAQAAVVSTKGSRLEALRKIGGKSVLPNADGSSVTLFVADKNAPDGIAIESVPDGSKAEVPDDVPPADPAA